MTTPEHILIVDDDAEIRSLLGDYLQKNGYRTTAVAEGKGMLAALDKGRVDLIVLDLMLPGDDGLVLCRNLRARSDIPVIMLTARGEDMDRILGLEMGADDYLPKPFNPRELLARIKSILRRAKALPGNMETGDAARVRFAGWELDIDLAPTGLAARGGGSAERFRIPPAADIPQSPQPGSQPGSTHGYDAGAGNGSFRKKHRRSGEPAPPPPGGRCQGTRPHQDGAGRRLHPGRAGGNDENDATVATIPVQPHGSDPARRTDSGAIGQRYLSICASATVCCFARTAWTRRNGLPIPSGC